VAVEAGDEVDCEAGVAEEVPDEGGTILTAAGFMYEQERVDMKIKAQNAKRKDAKRR
jgi:hypothetical protein